VDAAGREWNPEVVEEAHHPAMFGEQHFAGSF
jgi:hypothetical protein